MESISLCVCGGIELGFGLGIGIDICEVVVVWEGYL